MADEVVREMLKEMWHTLSPFVRAELYGLMRQYRHGDIRRPHPGPFAHPYAQLRWRARQRCRGMPKLVARERLRARVITLYMTKTRL
jgi:hypothetical protein